VLDPDRSELRKGAERIGVQPKVLLLLRFLLENAERTVTKDELLDALWPDTTVSEGSLTSLVGQGRRALGESQREGKILRTVHRVGYRMGVPVTREAGHPEIRQSADEAVPGLAELPGFSARPAIAVLAFDNLSADPEQEYFAHGVTEDLIATLSRSPDLLVISGSSSSRYAGQALDLKQVGRELGVAYAVEGSVRRAGDRVRIAAQLIDATADVHVWSQSYERDLSPANVFAIQSDIARQMANALQVQLLEWAGQRPSVHPTAWDFYARGRFLERRTTREDTREEARRLLERAIELDPGFAPAHATLALLYGNEFAFGPLHDTALLDRAETCARRSLELAPQDASGRLSLASVFYLQRKYIGAIREAREAIELNPSFDQAHGVLGVSQMKLGRLGDAKRSFDSVLQLNPRFPGAWFWAQRGTIHYLEGEIEQAVELWERARTMDRIRPERIMLARHYESAGRHEDAQAIVQEMLSVQPEMTAEMGVEMLAQPYSWSEEWIPEDLEEHLRGAGLP
jgi:TolB-like protein/Tfp pilus assembly protein PilF